MAKGVNSAAEQAEQLKQDGNLYFKKNRFGAAIDAYTEVPDSFHAHHLFDEMPISRCLILNLQAITLCPNVPVYWTNRALCHRKRNDWARVEEDCLRAVRLDPQSVKGHYMLGLALLQREIFAEGIKALERALDLGRGAQPNSYMVEEIWQELASAKYKEWLHDSTQQTLALQKLEKSCEIALEEKFVHDLSQKVDGTDEVSYSISKHLAALKLIFSKAVEANKPTEVPDYLCCKLTLDIFRDPVICPSGFTYERAVILDHLEKVGKFDPITRESLHPSQLIPNLAIKEAVGTYLEKHGWAYKMD
ncbi:hypothetical protein E3N88_33958 [Mikania micrantha]|uniref:E3 ubiquitin-protein ligase CHIP n=1 Tax=Mikania micrantha TaxID=192012 RepID=A0A5N6L7I1_9ASTR|nr:hypothetical protein E3N88_46028 [Mikania micrantha]KAD3338437.1 hypothetical protein E3N88_33958 [Mikania micrantha]